MDSKIRPLTEKEKLERYIVNLIAYREEIIKETNKEIAKAKIKIKKLEPKNQNKN